MQVKIFSQIFFRNEHANVLEPLMNEWLAAHPNIEIVRHETYHEKGVSVMKEPYGVYTVFLYYQEKVQ